MKFLKFLLVLALFASCKNKPQQTTEVVKKSEFSTEQKHAQLETIKRHASKKIEDWQEYAGVKNFLEQYKSISPNEALNNSKELNDLVKVMKDSANPEFLELDSFKARVNLLHNETLRLFDMSAISSIKSEEVNEQVTKVLDAFSSINSKINTLVQQADLDAQVDDPNFNRMLKDTLKAENVQKLEVVNPNETATQRKIRIQREQRKQRAKNKSMSFKPIQDVKKKKKNN